MKQKKNSGGKEQQASLRISRNNSRQTPGRAARSEKGQRLLVFIIFMMIMIALGVSDSNRGVFSGIFEGELALSKPRVSLIVTVSYVGNLLFMSIGGRAVDRLDKKKACMGILGLWTAAQAFFFCTDDYVCLLAGMFISMGASTLMNTMINILSPYFFGIMAGLYVNVLFFVQGIGTSANQKLTGSLADSFGDYRRLCGALGLVGLVCLAGLGAVKFHGEAASGKLSGEETDGKKTDAEKTDREKIVKMVPEGATGEGIAENAAMEDAVKKGRLGKGRSFGKGTNFGKGRNFGKGLWGTVILMGFVFGFYFVAEHGIMNWWAMYCSQGLGLEGKSASSSVAMFFGTMTLGRLLLAPLVQRLGSRRSILLLGGIGSGVYVLGVILGGRGVWILSVSGCFISIVYPTIVLFLQEVFPQETITAATGAVISVGTLFDIGFNAGFGSLVETLGFGVCRVVFPVAMIAFYVGFLWMQGREKRNFL